MENKTKVLYVEDNFQDADMTRMHFELEAPDFSLDVVDTGTACLEEIVKRNFDLILLDNRLPDMDGTDIINKLRAAGHMQPIVLATGVGDEETVAKALRAGAADYVSKSDKDYLNALPELFRRLITLPKESVPNTAKQDVQQILYVEPNKMDAELTTQHFAADAPHIQLKTVASSKEALVLLASKHHFDLLLADLQIPDMNALELIKEVKLRGITIPAVVITGQGDEAAAAAILRLGAYDYLVKRDNYLMQLPHAIDNALQRAHLDQMTHLLNDKLAVLNASLEKKVKARTAELTKEIAERKLAEQELRIAAVAFEAEEGIAITDANKVILRSNKSFTKITGYSSKDAIGKTYPIQHSARDNERAYQEIWDALSGKHHWYGEIVNYRKNGKPYPEWLNITAVINAEGEVTNYVVVFDDITLRKAAEEKIEHLAFYDPLTGLPNRRLLQDRLQHSFSVSARHNNHGALLFIDLDNFKILNDSKGHNIGDLLLVEVASRLQTCVRQVDTAARLGGDEFIILLGDLGAKEEQAATEVEAIGEKILHSLSQPYMLKEYEYHGSASIGIFLFCSNDDMVVEEALKYADSAMYQAKNAGRNTIRFYDPAMQKLLEARISMEADLRRAIARNQFKLYYQTQVTHNGDIIGAEALIRWRHPKLGLVSPQEFIPLAEETGLILPIGNWVLETACAQLKAWGANPNTKKLQLAINVSAVQFFQPDFVAQVRKTIRAHKIKPSLLKLELTESAILENVDDAIQKMTSLRKSGVRFSIDDFGTGYSSLSYLTQLPLDQLKIDKSFIFNIGSKGSEAIVQTIIGMANNLEMEVIAEGVESEEQRAFLEENGCMLCQGFLFSKPIPLKEFEKELKNLLT